LHSLKPIERWWFEKLVDGVLFPGSVTEDNAHVVAEWPKVVDKTMLHDNYLMFLDRLRENREKRSTQTELGMFLARYARAKRSRGKWFMAPVEECRALWVKECGWSQEHQWVEDSDDDADGTGDDVPF
jgi:hypothetical protein